MIMRSSIILLFCAAVAAADSEAEWQHMLSELREAGCPVSFVEMDARLDGTPLLAEAERWLRAPPAEATEVLLLLPQLTCVPNRDLLLTHRHYVELLAVPYGLVDEMLQRPRCDFGARRHPSYPHQMAYWNLITEVLELRVLVTAANGHAARAAAYLGDMAEIGRRMRGSGRGAMASSVARLVPHIVAVSRESRSVLRSVLEPVLERVPRVGKATAAIDTEIACTIDAVRRWSRGEKVSDAAKATSFAQDTGWSPEAGVDAETVSKVKTEVVKYIEEARKLKRSVETEPTEVLEFLPWVVKVPESRWGVLRDLVRVHVRSAVMAETEVNLARVGLAVALYRERHGEWPESLHELAGMFPGGSVPGDTAGGGEFVYSPAGILAEVSSRGGEWYSAPPSWMILDVNWK